MSNEYVVDKHGTKVYTCNYAWTDPDGHTERCRAPKACEVCGQCSRLDGERELGHCPGHLHLNEHIPGIPGRTETKVRDEATKRSIQFKEQRKQTKKPRRQKSQPIVERKPRA